MPSQQRKQPWHWHPLFSPILLPKHAVQLQGTPGDSCCPNWAWAKPRGVSWRSHEACTRAIRSIGRSYFWRIIAIQEYCWKETHMFNIGGGIMAWKSQGKFCWLRVMSIQRGCLRNRSRKSKLRHRLSSFRKSLRILLPHLSTLLKQECSPPPILGLCIANCRPPTGVTRLAWLPHTLRSLRSHIDYGDHSDVTVNRHAEVHDGGVWSAGR